MKLGTFLLAIAMPSTIALAADLSGTYNSDKLKLELKPQSEHHYTGTIYFAGQQFPATVDQTDAGAHGTFEAQGQKFSFDLLPGANGYTLRSDGVDYALTREAPAVANPLAAKPQPPATKAPADAPASPSGAKDPLAYKVQQLPGGTVATFDGWKYMQVPADNALILDCAPDGHQKDFILRTVVATPNQADLQNLFTVAPQLTQQLLMALSPTFRRTGEQKQTKVGGDDAMIEEYEGNVNNTPVKVRALYVRREDVGIGVLGIGTDDGFKQYSRAIEIVAQSITFKQSPLEPELVGTWTFETVSRVEGVHASDAVSVGSTRSITILPNSTFTDSNSGVTTGPGVTGLQQGASRGKLVKRGSTLTFHYDDGHTWSAQYEVGGGGLKLNGQLYIKQ
jgi:hypothetical protein